MLLVTKHASYAGMLRHKQHVEEGAYVSFPDQGAVAHRMLSEF